MGAGGEFGHDAAERAMRGVLAGDGLRDDGPVAAHQRDGGFVAGRFDTEDQAHARLVAAAAARVELALGPQGVR